MNKIVYTILPDKDYIKVKGECKEENLSFILRLKSQEDIYKLGNTMKKAIKNFDKYSYNKKLEIVLNN